MALMPNNYRFISPYTLKRYSTAAYHYEETMSDPYEWTNVMSRKTLDTMKKNDKNRWLDQFLRTGNGLAGNVFSFLDVMTLVQLRHTSRILDKFVLRYCQNNMTHGTNKGINDVAHFMFLFPNVTEISLPQFKLNTGLLTPDIFMESKHLHTLMLHNCNFTDLHLNPRSFRGIVTVSLYNCFIPDETPDWNLFSCMDSVETLSLQYTTGHITGANCFIYLPSLTNLNISYKGDDTLTDNCWEIIANTCPLVQLFAGHSYEITDVAIECVTRSGLLQKLDINSCMSHLLTPECHPFLKRVPELDMNDCIYSMIHENCPECHRTRRIDRIDHHLEHECNMQCTLCQETVMITHQVIHLMYKCNENYIECKDCGCSYLQRKEIRHRRLCNMRLITCDLCDDKTPYHKKDYKAHLAKHLNHSRHCDTLTQKIKVLHSNITTIGRAISDLITDANDDGIFLHDDAYPSKHHAFVKELEITVSKHVNHELKQLMVKHNLLRQFLFMRKYYRTQIERSIAEIQQQREDEHEEANSHYWDDYDEYYRRSHWSDYD